MTDCIRRNSYVIQTGKSEFKSLYRAGPTLGLRNSRGQAKPTNKNRNFLMAEKILGKHADSNDRLRQACGQFLSQSHEPFLRKCLNKERVPENLANTKTNRKNHEKVRNRFLSFG